MLPDLLRSAPANNESDCTSYEAPYTGIYQSVCSSGDVSNGKSSGRFYQYTGKNCSTKGISSGWGFGGSLGFNNGSFENINSVGSPAAVPMTGGCAPDTPCSNGGAESGAN